MDLFSKSVGVIAALAFLALFSHIYFWRRKMWRAADEDLQRSDSEEWKRHFSFSRYVRFISRLIWGSAFAYFGVAYLMNERASGVIPLITISFMLSLTFILWAIFGFRNDNKTMKELQ